MEVLLVVVGAVLAVGGGYVQQRLESQRELRREHAAEQRETIRSLQDVVQVATALADRLALDTLRCLWRYENTQEMGAEPVGVDDLQSALADIERHASRVLDDDLRAAAERLERRGQMVASNASGVTIGFTNVEEVTADRKKFSDDRREVYKLAGDLLRRPFEG